MKAELFLAGRYLKPKRSTVAVITLISVIGVALGVAVLMIVLAVMTGFSDHLKEKLLETQSHFQVRAFQNAPIRYPGRVLREIRNAGADGAAVTISPVLAQIGDHLDPKVAVLAARPEDLHKFMKLDRMLLEGQAWLEPGAMMISHRLARRWNVRRGDTVLLHSPGKITSMVKVQPDGSVEFNKDGSVYLPGEFRITGIFSFDKYDFDNTMLFINRNDAAELLNLPPGSANAVFGWVADPFNMNDTLKELNARLAPQNLHVAGWQEMNRQIIDVLSTEKTMMFFLLIFIVLVAAFSITNTLITSVYQKTREIGILKALGAGDGTVMRIFVLQGMLVGIIGSIAGTLLGYLVILFRNDIMKIAEKITGRALFPAELYIFSELPAHIVPGDVALIVIISIVLCTLGGVIPAWRAARLDPAKALRYE